MGEELNSLSLLNLRDLAKSKGMKNVSKLNKEDLIKEIMKLTSDKTEVVKKDIEVSSNDEKKLELEGATLNSKDDFVVEGVLEVLADGFGF